MHILAGDSVKTFQWANWIDAAMGFIKGIDNTLVNNGGKIPAHIANWRKKTPYKCDLTIPIQTISARHPEIPYLQGDIRIWMGWPFFDIKLVHFEMNQWMQAADLMHGFSDAVRPLIEDWEETLVEEVKRAEEGLRTIIAWMRR